MANKRQALILLPLLLAGCGGTVKAVSATPTTQPTTTTAPTTTTTAPTTTTRLVTTTTIDPQALAEAAWRQTVRNRGGNPDQETTMAKAVCTMLDSGKTMYDVAASLVKLSSEQGGRILSGATDVFCPKYKPALDDFERQMAASAASRGR